MTNGSCCACNKVIYRFDSIDRVGCGENPFVQSTPLELGQLGLARGDWLERMVYRG